MELNNYLKIQKLSSAGADPFKRFRMFCTKYLFFWPPCILAIKCPVMDLTQHPWSRSGKEQSAGFDDYELWLVLASGFTVMVRGAFGCCFTVRPFWRYGMRKDLSYEEMEYRLRLLEKESKWRNQAENALRKSEERLKVLFEYAPDMYFMIDRNGKLIDANRAAEKISGFQKSEVIGKNLFDLGMISEDQAEKALILLSKVVAREPTDPEEFEIQTQNGKRLTVEIRTFPTVIENDEVVLTIARDVTRQKEMLNLLKNQGDRYRYFFFENQTLPLLIADTASERFLDINRSARDYLGYTHPEFTSLSMEKIGLKPSLFDRNNNSGMQPANCLLYRKDGTRIDSRVQAELMDPGEMIWLVRLLFKTDRTDSLYK